MIDALGVQPGDIIADFGAGSGAYVHAIAEKLNNVGHVYAIDVQQDLLRRIRNEAHKRGYTNIETIWTDLERPHGAKIADAHVDLVLISNLLFQVTHKHVVLAEARRIVKPSGFLIIIDWSESYGGMGPIKKEVVKKEQAIQLAEAAGFQKAGEFAAGAHHYGIVFRPNGHSHSHV